MSLPLALLGFIITASVIIVALYVLILVFRDSNVLLTAPPENQWVLIVRAEDFYDAFANVNGHIVDVNCNTKPLTDAEISARTNSKGEFRHRLSDHTVRKNHSWVEELLWRYLGVYYIGLPGTGKVYRIKIRKNSKKEYADDSANSFATKWISYAGEESMVFSFRREFPRPIAVVDAELEEGSDLSLAFEIVLRTINAKKAVIDYPGDAVANAENVTIQVILNWLRTRGMSYSESLRKDLGENSDFIRDVMDGVNDGTTATDGSRIEGIEKRLGLRLISVFLIELAPGRKTQKLAEAQVAESVAIAEGKGVVARAKADAEAVLLKKRAEAEGDETRIRQRVKAYTDQDVAPDNAAEQVGAVDRRAETPGATTIIEKGSFRLGD